MPSVLGGAACSDGVADRGHVGRRSSGSSFAITATLRGRFQSEGVNVTLAVTPPLTVTPTLSRDVDGHVG